MGLISTTIPNLVNGVSQQPFALRLASQSEEQDNCHASVVEGLRKRPPSRYVAKIRSTPYADGGVFVHTINRDKAERYIVLIENGTLLVRGIDGTAKTVAFPDGTSYLNAADPGSSFQAVTIADYTFVVNKTVTVAKSASLSPSTPFQALVWVRQAAYSSNFLLRLDGTDVLYTTATGTDALKTDDIAHQLALLILALPGTPYTVTQYGSVLHIQRTDLADFTITNSDSLSDTGLKVVKNSVQHLSDLPAKASVDGFTVKIAGDPSSAFDDYWATYDLDGGSIGVWKEGMKGGEQYAFDLSTMPHVLVREADGTFTFKRAVWEERKVGDNDIAPFPSFVGRTISDVFFYRNRLGFIADENVVCSRAGDFFNFFRETATQLLDSDPVDVAASHTKVSLLRHAVPYNEAMLLFSDQTQFRMNAEGILSPKTVSIAQTTEFESSLLAKPVGSGKNVYFCVNKGGYTGVREYFTDQDTKTNDAADVTAHVPKYVPGNVVKLASSSNEDTLVALSKNDRERLYVYKYYWSGSDKLQSSWGKWTFEGDTILNVDFLESDIYRVYQREDGVFIDVLSVEPGRTDPDASFTFHLDRRLDETQVSTSYDAGTGNTTITLPYTEASLQVVCRVSGGSFKQGQVLQVVSNTGTSLVVRGDLSSLAFYVGRPYTMRYRFSTFVIREEAQGGGVMSVGEGRLAIRYASVLFNNAGYFRAEVTPTGRDTYTYTFSRIIGSGANVLGAVSIEQGKFKFPVMEKNDQAVVELVNDTFLPSNFLSAEWEADYTIRSRRM